MDENRFCIYDKRWINQNEQHISPQVIVEAWLFDFFAEDFVWYQVFFRNT